MQVQYAEQCKAKAAEYLQSRVSAASTQVHAKPRSYWEGKQKAAAMKVKLCFVNTLSCHLKRPYLFRLGTGWE